MRSALAAVLVLAAWSAGAQPAAPAEVRPDVLMSGVTTEVIAVLKHDAAAGQPTDVVRLVETKILPLFDFRHMTRIAVARNWRLASPEQQAALVVQFRTLLVRTYSSALSTYRDEEIEYKPLRFAPGETDVLVRSAVRRRGAETLTLDYDMESTEAGWKVYDVKIAGVSMVLAYRETFAEAVRAGGIDGLIKQLSDKNGQNESRPKGAGPQTLLAPVLVLRLVRERL
ncbi:MAG TPA: ABC transporter substrate-binding protein [Burkholderiales bacterium]|jgi:phospholipid transport system substrate-binding protein